MRSPGWWSGLSRRRRVFTAVIVAAAVALAGFVGVRLVAGGSAGDTPAGFPDQARPGPVLLVPGYGGSVASLATLADRLRATGRRADVVSLPGDGTGDLLAQVAALDSAVGDALAAGAPSVDVVGYSAGGVVTRLWVQRDAGAHKARRVITLGSPLHGTTVAAVGSALVPGVCPLACQQLTPGSALLRDLDADPLPSPLPWLSLWTEDDQTVNPPDSASLPGAINVPVQRVCPGIEVAHGGLPGEPLVIGIVLAALSAPSVRAPDPARCAALSAAGRG